MASPTTIDKEPESAGGVGEVDRSATVETRLMLLSLIGGSYAAEAEAGLALNEFVPARTPRRMRGSAEGPRDRGNRVRRCRSRSSNRGPQNKLVREALRCVEETIDDRRSYGVTIGDR